MDSASSSSNSHVEIRAINLSSTTVAVLNSDSCHESEMHWSLINVSIYIFQSVQPILANVHLVRKIAFSCPSGTSVVITTGTWNDGKGEEVDW